MNITLSGGGFYIIRLTEFLLKQEKINKINIITSSRQASEKVLDISFKENINHFLKNNDNNIINFETIDNLDNPVYFQLVEKSDLVISLGSAWIFKKRHIDACKYLVNLHCTDLPRWRGGAPTSWRILSGINYGSVTLHKINESIDDGDIIYKKKFIFPETCNTPIEFDNYTHKVAVDFLYDFIKNFEIYKRKLIPMAQQNEFSSYFPRLSSEIHGCINWDWKPVDLVRFIKAFDDPYKGAFTKISSNNEKVFLKKAIMLEGEINYHPFQSGIIFRKDHNGLYICANGGAILVSQITNNAGELINDKIALGTRLFSSLEDLEKSKSKSITYNSKGKV